jgi:hypothetical protein
MAKWELNHHRTHTVRWAARHNLLAYGLLRKVPYQAIERHTACPPQWSIVEKHARKFGGEDLYIQAWIDSAKDYLKAQKNPLRIAS